jgi:hypothetical protein
LLSDGYVSWYDDSGTFYYPSSSSEEDDGESRYLSMSSSSWTRHSIYREAGDGDGRLVFEVGTSDRSYSNLYNIATKSGSVLLGLMVANATSTHDMYVDDVYVDSTRARVELCRGSTWESRVSCDIQIPTAWSTSSITASVNTGAFDAGDTAYVYVVDSDGNVNNSVHSVVIGESVSDYVYSDVGVVTDTDDSAYGTFAWQSNSYTADRSDEYVYLTISRTSGSDGDVSVQWSSNSGTAVHGTDYYGSDNVTVDFADGETSQQVAIELIQNDATEDLSFTVSLANATDGASLGSTTTATVTILGTDTLAPPPELRLE